MGVVANFDPVAWAQLFPEFGYLSPVQISSYFSIATTVHRNDGGGPVSDVTVQLNLLNLLTAHVAALFAPKANGQQASPIVGRITDASEGSVSVGTENNYPPGTVQWFQQTKYGSMYYVATAPYRTMRYIPNNASPINAGLFPFNVMR